MFVAQRYCYRKLTARTVSVVARLDAAVVQLYQRACQVESDARSYVAVVGAGWRLVEAFKDALQLVFRNLFAIVEDADRCLFLVGSQCDTYLATCGCKLKRIRQDIDDDLVEVATVYPCHDTFLVAVEVEQDVLVLRLLGKQRINVVDEAYQVGVAHVQLHLALVNLSQVHHLVDEA